MTDGAVAPVNAAADRSFLGHPAGLATVFFVEMWERMSFYGMRALLILFLVDQVIHGGAGMDDRTAAAIYGLYVGATYISCLPGGWIGDRILGAQRAVLIGGIIITAGHLLLGVAPSLKVFFVGLLVIVVGTGLLKTNASALVAQLYPEGGARRDAGFTIYYIGVNVGATIGPLVSGFLALRYGWPAGFMSAAAGMTLGVLQFLWGRRLLGDAGRSPTSHSSDAALKTAPPAGAIRAVAIAMAALIALAALFWSGVIQVTPVALGVLSTDAVIGVAILYFAYLLFFAGLTGDERLRVLVVIVLFIASVLFWAGYEQTGSSLNLFAERYTDRHLGSFVVPAEWFQSLNPVFIVIFGSLLSALWIALARRNRDPSMGMKFIFGLLGMGSGFIVIAAASRLVVSGHQVGMGWLTATYLLHTWGELCLSPVGLSAVSKLVPRRFVGQSIGIFFVSLSLGNLLAGRIAGNFDATNLAAMPGQFMFIFWFGAICAVGVACMLPLMKRWSGGVT
jgi:proton-dependent oligopeptide transporter, POT family